MSGLVEPTQLPGALGRQLGRQLRLAPVALTTMVTCALVGLGASLLVPAVTAATVGRVLDGTDWLPAVVTLLAVLVLRSVADAGGTLASVSASVKTTVVLRDRLLRRAFRVDRDGTSPPAGDLLTRITANAAVAGGLSSVAVSTVVSCVASVGGMVGLWLVDWRLGAMFLGGLVPAGVLLHLLTARVSDAHSEYLAILGGIASRLADALAGWQTIRVNGTTARECARVLEPLPTLAERGRAGWLVRQTGSWQLDAIQTLMSVGGLGLAGLGLARGRLTPGEFLAAYLYLNLALAAFDQPDNWFRLGDAWAHTQRAVAASDPAPGIPSPPEQPQAPYQGRHLRHEAPAGASLRVLDAAARDRSLAVPDPAAPPGGRHARVEPPALWLRGVSLVRGERTVLDGLTLEVPRAAAVALVGRSGSGKSLVALLAGRLALPDEGRILLDGRSVADLEPARLRREIAFAFERPLLLGETVHDALAYGRPAATRAEVEEAARVADAEGFIRRLPHGFDTRVAEAPLSGGERQRLGLARAVVQGARILVLDDAMSSLDTLTEARVSDAVTRRLAGTTRLVIAHRARTAAAADLVAWLEDGRIRAVAPHTDLWARQPDYRRVFTPAPESEET